MKWPAAQRTIVPRADVALAVGAMSRRGLEACAQGGESWSGRRAR